MRNRLYTHFLAFDMHVLVLTRGSLATWNGRAAAHTRCPVLFSALTTPRFFSGFPWSIPLLGGAFHWRKHPHRRLGLLATATIYVRLFVRHVLHMPLQLSLHVPALLFLPKDAWVGMGTCHCIGLHCNWSTLPPHIVFGTVGTGARLHRRVASRARMDGACVRAFWRKEEIEEHSPSRKEGVPRAVEALCRRAACQLVIDTGARLKLCVATHVASRICGEEKVTDRGVDVMHQAAADRRHVHRVLPRVLRQAILARTRPSCASQRFARR